MHLAEVKPVEGRTQVTLTGNGARILHTAFVGRHHYSHGMQMQSQLEAGVAAERPNGVLIDLLTYEYEFGNDVCGLFLAGWHSKFKTWVPTCIVAIGKTRTSLESLYTSGNFELAPYFRFADSVADGLAWLSKSRDAGTVEQRDELP